MKYKSYVSFLPRLLRLLFRCTAPADGLDDDKFGHHSQEHTDLLVEEFELGVLFDEYGLVGDIVVHSIFSCIFIICLPP